MTTLSKDKIMNLARESGIDDWWTSGNEMKEVLDAHLAKFATLCRADLVAENEKWKQVHEVNTDTLNAMQAEIDELRAENDALKLQVKFQSRPFMDMQELFAERDSLKAALEATSNAEETLRAENERLRGEQSVLIKLFREGLDVLETLVGESTDEQESLDDLTEKMNNAINDIEYRHD